ncbi:uncharacterized protein MYCFIDRAFT_214265 [Pseudocercospora fijiensis CIRAD86]|uniref:Palmitoyltransferase n=1 Tax=Pseudocercospora fijiensis (strain CIRAD86) TaxID=383855 RepID=M3BB94_PSEFD|nr:uncharacterized protein MYCFIDRAFT_214265 [Pseudocercospora fijiensis CIRAD86]EME86488.1 hypothetical protein MYCFIDRAFT_214265 [Pseudocercospora fijiensis CIRAD86]
MASTSRTTAGTTTHTHTAIEQNTHSHSAIPTFLGNHPYPSNHARSTTASSNGTSESDTAQLSVPSTTGPVGEPALPPSRPTSGAVTQEAWSRISSSHASVRSPPSRHTYTSLRSRDGEPNSRPSSGTGTHVPSIAAQAFFRPMSSHKLQTQRGQNVAPPASSHSHSHMRIASVDEDGDGDGDGDEESTTRTHRYSAHRYSTHRYSNASVNTAREAEQATRHGASSPPPLPTSRGLSIATSSGEDGRLNAAPASVISKNSTTPLTLQQAREQQQRQRPDPPPKSPRSLRRSLSRGFGSIHSSKRDIHEPRPSGQGHEKLPSLPNSPLMEKARDKPLPSQPPRRQLQPSGKNYEYFAGNMLFFVEGRCLNTRAKPLNVATFLLTVIPAALFFAFEAPWIWHNITPAIPIVFAYVFFVALSAFAHAAFSDPGILPRNMHPHPPNPEEKDPLAVGPATTEWVMVKTFPSSRQQPHLEAMAEDGDAAGATTAMEVPTKYCKSCNIWRPPRTHHCRVCDACIETQDHHCVWLNNCVGRRNYRYFFAYVGFSSLMALMLIAFALTHIAVYANQSGISFGKSLTGRTEERVAFAMFIYAVLALPYPGSLFGYHLFLIARGETTREYLNSHKFMQKDRHRPFSQSSILSNWAVVLFRPRPPSYMGFKKSYDDGDQRLGYTLRRKERLEKERHEAARSASRVDGLKKRFSVTRGAGNANGGMEMKDLPPTPTANGTANGAPGGVTKKNNPPGGMNSTPR